MAEVVSGERVEGGRLHIARSRGAASGFLVILLGLWGALVPFAGPAFGFAYNPDQGSAWSAARGWLEVLPGAVAVIGGLLLLLSQNRATAMMGGWLSVVAGAWFVIGRVMATTLTIGEIGRPVAETDVKAAWLELTYFYGLGALLVFLGAIALGRVSVRSVRDVDHAQRVATARHDDKVDEDSAALTGPVTEAKPKQVDGDRTDVGDGTKRSWRHPLRRGDRNTTTAAR